MSERQKVLLLVIPASGHLNIMSCIAHELVHKNNMHVIMYSISKFKEQIDKTGAEYRVYPYSLMDISADKSNNIFRVLEDIAEATFTILPELIRFCKEEKPDLVLWDYGTIWGYHLLNYLENNLKNRGETIPIPKAIVVYPCFVFVKGIFPNKAEEKQMYGTLTFAMIKSIFKVYLKQRNINKTFRLTMPNSITEMVKYLEQVDVLSICGFIKELQPIADKLPAKFRYVGCCLNDQVRSLNVTDKTLIEILNSFKPINPKYSTNVSDESEKPSKLVYVSLGTVYNSNTKIFEKIINAFTTFEEEKQETSSQIKRTNLVVVISLGSITYELFQEKISKQGYQVPENILLLPNVPQIDVLKRASLFITHAGMNSTSETIHYGVPVICLPMFGDQQLVARRICDQLNFGIRLESLKVKMPEIRQAIHQVLKEPIYLENVLEYTKLSHQNNGIQNAANLIQSYLNTNETKQN